MGLPPPPNAVSVGIDSARWLKLCKDAKLMSSKFRPVDVDLIFTRNAVQRRLEFFGFQDALVEVATKKGVDGEKLIDNLLAATYEGPSIRGTFAESVRLHDDKSTYTGVYKAGGPTIVDYEKMSMNQICDRSKKATIRGVPAIAVEGPGGVNALMEKTLPISPYIDTPVLTIVEQQQAHSISSAGHKIFKSTKHGLGVEESKVERGSDRGPLSPESLKKLKAIYLSYTDASNRSNAKLHNEAAYLAPPPNPVANGVDSARFMKMLKDGKILDSKFRLFDLDIVYKKYSDKRRMNYKGLVKSILEISTKKGIDPTRLVDRLFANTAEGPSNTGTFADDHVRLHDDKTTYTGVYRSGGPTVVDMEKMSFSQLVSRGNRGNLRGVPTWAVHGPGDKFAANNHHNAGLASSQKHYSQRSHSHGYTASVEGPHRFHDDVSEAPTSPPTKMEKAHAVLGKYAVSTKKGKQLIRGHSQARRTPEHDDGIFEEDVDGGSPLSAKDLTGSPSKYVLTEQDMEINSEQEEHLKAIYAQYELHSRSYKEQQEIKNHMHDELDIFHGPNSGVDSSKFLRLCQDAHLIDHTFKKSEVDLVFMKQQKGKSSKGHRKLDFGDFCNGLLEVAVRKNMPMTKLLMQMDKYDLANKGPAAHAHSKAEYNRFYDDAGTFTGVYKQGGPDHRQDNDYLSSFRKEEGSPGAHYASAREAGGHAHRSVEVDLSDPIHKEVEEEIDMSITQLQLEELGLVYDSYEKASSGKDEGIDSARFLKLCKDVNLLDDAFTRTDVDIIFTRFKHGARKINFEHFQDAVLEIAKKKKVPLGSVVDSIDYHASMGVAYHNGTTSTSYNRFYDDHDTFTGVYKKGGPDHNQANDFIESFRKDLGTSGNNELGKTLSMSEANRFYDDKSTFTGVYKKGGPDFK
jgi:hypothetical protein